MNCPNTITCLLEYKVLAFILNIIIIHVNLIYYVTKEFYCSHMHNYWLGSKKHGEENEDMWNNIFITKLAPPLTRNWLGTTPGPSQDPYMLITLFISIKSLSWARSGFGFSWQHQFPTAIDFDIEGIRSPWVHHGKLFSSTFRWIWPHLQIPSELFRIGQTKRVTFLVRVNTGFWILYQVESIRDAS